MQDFKDPWAPNDPSGPTTTQFSFEFEEEVPPTPRPLISDYSISQICSAITTAAFIVACGILAHGCLMAAN